MCFKRVLLFLIMLFAICSVIDLNVYGADNNDSVLTQHFVDFLEGIKNGNSNEEKVSNLLKYYSENRIKSRKNLTFPDVIYENNTWLFRTEKLSNKDILKEREDRSGIYNMIGRLVIPDIDINMAIFNTNAQAVVDAKDSAACFKSGDTFLVADHWYSGFERIRDCKKGDVAYVDMGDKVYEFVCVEVIKGHNTGKHLTDWDDNSIMYDKNPNGLTLYTCMDSWRNIRIAFFKPNNLYLPVDKLG